MFSSEILQVLRSLCEDLCFFNRRIMDSLPSTPQILTPFNCVDWRAYMQVSLHNKGYFRIILGREVELHQLVERNKFLNCLDEAFHYLCTHISIDLLFVKNTTSRFILQSCNIKTVGLCSPTNILI